MVEAEKVMLVIPENTVTDAGTVTLERLLLIFTTIPPFGAMPLRVIVPMEGVPPVTTFGLKLIPASPTGAMVRVAVCVVVPSVAVMVATV